MRESGLVQLADISRSKMGMLAIVPVSTRNFATPSPPVQRPVSQPAQMSDIKWRVEFVEAVKVSQWSILANMIASNKNKREYEPDYMRAGMAEHDRRTLESEWHYFLKELMMRIGSRYGLPKEVFRSFISSNITNTEQRQKALDLLAYI
jgi:hypothetical protein